MDPHANRPPPSIRLFFALWPDHRVRAALGARAAALPAPARPTLESKLHMTLLFMDRASPAALPLLRAVGEVVAAQASPFDLRLDRAGLWAGGVSHLAPSSPPPELMQLRDALAAAARGIGVAFDDRGFRPHVTLARRATTAPEPGAGVHWHADGFALVESLLGTGRYAVRGRWRCGAGR